LLDSPGIIPAKQVNQECALKLAICNDIGEASYDVERVAASLVELLRATHADRPGFFDLSVFNARYKIQGDDSGDDDSEEQRTVLTCASGEDFIWRLAASQHKGDRTMAARRILVDLRQGRLGRFALDVPPTMAATTEASPAPDTPTARSQEHAAADADAAAAGADALMAPRATNASGSDITATREAVLSDYRPPIYSSKADPASSRDVDGPSPGLAGPQKERSLKRAKAAAAKNERSGDGKRRVVFNKGAAAGALGKKEGGSEQDDEDKDGGGEKGVDASVASPPQGSSKDAGKKVWPDAAQMGASTFEGW